jgi:hypothetical protein
VIEILPDKFTPIEQTLVGRSAVLLALVSEKSYTVGGLFVAAKERMSPVTFETFAASLAFLYAADLIDHNDGILEVS